MTCHLLALYNEFNFSPIYFLRHLLQGRKPVLNRGLPALFKI